MIEKDNSLRARFVKDFRLPIKTVREIFHEGESLDSFLYLINKLDPYYGSKEKYKLFLDYIKNFNDKEEFFEYNKKVIDDVQNYILNNVYFKELASYDMSEYKPIYDISKIKRSPYLVKENDGEEFFSIDIKEANFQSLSFFDDKIFNDHKDFKSLLREYTDKEYIIQSKSIRQVIFGDKKLNPKRQQMIQKYIMSHVLKVLFENGFVSKEASIQTTSDEVIISKKFLLKDYSNFFENLPEEIQKINFHQTEFSIEYLETKESFKENIFLYHSDGSTKIKNCPAKYIPEVIAYLDNNRNVENYKKNINFLDRLVYENNRTYSFLDFIFD